MLVIMAILSLFFVIILFVYGVPDSWPLITGYMGLLLYGAATIAIGLFASALSPNQIVGLVVGSGLLTGLTIIDFISDRVTGTASEVLNGLQLGASFSVFDLNSFGVAEAGHFADFARGVISVSDIAYYVSVTTLFVFLTVMLLQIRRWR